MHKIQPARMCGLMALAAILSIFLGARLSVAFGRQQPDDSQNTGEIAISRTWFGVGGSVRPGEWAGIQLKLNDSSDKPREVLVRILMNDSDGDKIMWETSLTTNPGVNQPVWAYVRIPARFRPNEPLKVTAHAAVEGSGPAAGDASGLAAGRQLATANIQCSQVISSSEGMLGIVGSRELGLARYSGVPGFNFLPTGHERWEVLTRLDPDTLPDRWMGLMQFAALVWNDPQPGALNSEKSQAIREWVQRGGHLIVVLPAVSQTWTDEANNPLFDITPRVRINRREGVDLEPLRTLITRLPKDAADLANKPLERLDTPTNEIVQSMTPMPGATREEAACIMAMPAAMSQGTPEWLVARRQVGTGMVTMIGLNVGSSWMNQKALPDPELFWHRILGRRGEMATVKANGELSTNLSSVARAPITLDNSIADQIAKTTLAGAGVLMGLAIFVIYWLVAGPLGYAALKRSGNQRHTWVGFVAAAGLFTGIAWGGATIIRPAKVSAAHLTILDHVYTPLGESVQRARSWVSVLIPEYGEASVAVGDPSKSGSARFHNLIAPWEPENASTAGFPDARAYRINSRAPDHYSIPTRSTVKQFQIDWAGGPAWKMPRPVANSKGEPTEITAALVKNNPVLTGTISHELPEPLREVTIVVNMGQNPLNTSFAGTGAWRETSNVFVADLTDAWEPGVPLDLSKLGKFSRGDGAQQSDGAFGKLLSDLAQTADGSEGLGGASLRVLTWKMKALAFFGAIEPPNLSEEKNRRTSFTGLPMIRRRSTHGMDLSPWFTQPCIIIVGYVGKDNDAPSPVPLMVSTGGSYHTVPTTGRTFVRWVYPLPSNPPAFKSDSEASARDGQQPSTKDPT